MSERQRLLRGMQGVAIAWTSMAAGALSQSQTMWPWSLAMGAICGMVAWTAGYWLPKHPPSHHDTKHHHHQHSR